MLPKGKTAPQPEAEKKTCPTSLIKQHIMQIINLLDKEKEKGLGPDPPPPDGIVFKINPRFLKVKLPDDTKEVLIFVITDKGECEVPAMEFSEEYDDKSVNASHLGLDADSNQLHILQSKADTTTCTLFAIEEMPAIKKKKRHRKILRTTDILESGEITVNMCVNDIKSKEYTMFTPLDKDADPEDDFAAPEAVPSGSSSGPVIVKTTSLQEPNFYTKAVSQFGIPENPNTWTSIFHCVKCNNTFASKHALSSHPCPADQAKCFVCKTCNAGFLQYKDFIEHLKLHSKDTQRVDFVISNVSSLAKMDESTYCNPCKTAFSSVQELKTHQTLKHSKKIFICDQCNKLFNTIEDIAAHKKTHVLQNLDSPTTSGQNAKNKTAPEGQMTQNNVVMNNSLLFGKDGQATMLIGCATTGITPPITGSNALTNKGIIYLRPQSSNSILKATEIKKEVNILPKAADAVTIKRKSSELNETVSSPSVSNKTQKVSIKSNDGIQSVSPKKKSNFGCVLCSKTFSTLRQLQRHKLTHADGRAEAIQSNFQIPKIFLCNVCDQEFTSPSALASHKRSHWENTYYCKGCKARFETQEAMELHRKSKCDDKLVCDRCGKQYMCTTALHKHMVMHSGERLFPCTICNFKFFTKEHLSRHMRIHGEKKYQCDECPMKFVDREHLRRHQNGHKRNMKMRRIFGKKLTFRCSLCVEMFDSPARLMQHYEDLHPLSSYKCIDCRTSVSSFPALREHFRMNHKGVIISCCRICGDAFSEKAQFQSHRAIHGRRDVKYISKPVKKQKATDKWCPICQNFFASNTDFRIHLSYSNHCEKELNEKLNAFNNSTCDDCSKTFAKPELLEIHKNTHGSDPPFTCNICTNSFEDGASLDDHLITHQDVFIVEGSDTEENETETRSKQQQQHQPQYVCKVCGRSFHSLSALTIHSYLHEKIKPLKCEECGLVFSSVSKLSMHQLVHKGHKSYRCSLCWKSFWAKTALMTHLRKTHSKQNKEIEERHKCPLCDRTFAMKSNLSNHMRRHEGEKGLLKKKFSCSECNRTFTTRAHLIIHEQTHKGIGLVCPECGRKFTTLTWLQYHMRIHTGESPKCHICGRGFATRRTMEEHVATHGQVQGSFVCDVCGASFGSNRYLSFHMKLKHNGITPVVCKKCGLGFQSPEMLTEHATTCSSQMGEHSNQTQLHQMQSDGSANEHDLNAFSETDTAAPEVMDATTTVTSIETQTFPIDLVQTVMEEETVGGELVREIIYQDSAQIALAEQVHQAPMEETVVTNSEEVSSDLILDGAQIALEEQVHQAPIEETVITNSEEVSSDLILDGAQIALEEQVHQAPIEETVVIKSEEDPSDLILDGPQESICLQLVFHSS